MSFEAPKTPEQNKEAIFQSWLVEFSGRYWLNPDAMPKQVSEAAQLYFHFEGNSFHMKDGAEKNDMLEKMKKAAEDFEQLTGYEMADFIKYKDEQEEKLKLEKK